MEILTFILILVLVLIVFGILIWGGLTHWKFTSPKYSCQKNSNNLYSCMTNANGSLNLDQCNLVCPPKKND